MKKMPDVSPNQVKPEPVRAAVSAKRRWSTESTESQQHRSVSSSKPKAPKRSLEVEGEFQNICQDN